MSEKPSYEKSKQAVDKLATEMVKHGMARDSESAQRKAAEIARQADKKQGR